MSCGQCGLVWKALVNIMCFDGVTSIFDNSIRYVLYCGVLLIQEFGRDFCTVTH